VGTHEKLAQDDEPSRKQDLRSSTNGALSAHHFDQALAAEMDETRSVAIQTYTARTPPASGLRPFRT
jgi:hypothetical protein